MGREVQEHQEEIHWRDCHYFHRRRCAQDYRDAEGPGLNQPEFTISENISPSVAMGRNGSKRAYHACFPPISFKLGAPQSDKQDIPARGEPCFQAGPDAGERRVSAMFIPKKGLWVFVTAMSLT